MTSSEWSLSQPHRPLWSSPNVPNSFLSQALTVFSPHLGDSSPTLQGLIHPEFLSLLKCHLLKEAFSDGCVLLPLCPPQHTVPAPAHCASLHSLSFFHFTAKFLMIRLHCAIIISKFQFKIIGIFYIPLREHKLQESRDRGIFSPVLPREPKPGSRDTVNPPSHFSPKFQAIWSQIPSTYFTLGRPSEMGLL